MAASRWVFASHLQIKLQSFAQSSIMQFSTVAIIAASVAAVSASNATTVTDVSSTLVTITSCGPEVTDCPATHANVSTYSAGANKQFAAGAVALAAGALLAL